jgi:hypothetical protein
VVPVGARDGDAGWRMEWVKPIGMMELDFRRQGVFLLVDVSGKKLWFFGYKRDQSAINQMMETLRGRCDEMVNFLIARARAKG